MQAYLDICLCSACWCCCGWNDMMRVIECHLKKSLLLTKGAITDELAHLQTLEYLEPKFLKLVNDFSLLHFTVQCGRQREPLNKLISNNLQGQNGVFMQLGIKNMCLSNEADSPRNIWSYISTLFWKYVQTSKRRRISSFNLTCPTKLDKDWKNLKQNHVKRRNEI